MQSEINNKPASGKKFWLFLIALAVVTPLGIILPMKFGSGETWGEWSAEKLNALAGYIPQGLQKLSNLWKAPFAEYNIFGGNNSVLAQSVSYILSALVGITLIWILFKGLNYLLGKNGK